MALRVIRRRTGDRLGEQLGAQLDLPEAIVNELGWRYLQTGQSELAVAAFRFNTSNTRNRQTRGTASAMGYSVAAKSPRRLQRIERHPNCRGRNSS